MSDYTNTFGGAAKDGINATVLGADHDTQLDAIASMSATKQDKLNAVTVAGQPNITSVGTLTSLSVTGTITSGAVNSNVKLNTKVLTVYPWDMDSFIAASGSHGLTLSKIRTVEVQILNTAGTTLHPLDYHDGANSASGSSTVSSVTVNLLRDTSGIFNAPGWDDATAYITIQYVD